MKRLCQLAVVIMALCAPAWATSYFISPTGSDGNNGTSTGTAWASPNHAVNCVDTISVAAGSYTSANFGIGKWGTVSGCGTGNSQGVAWVFCVGNPGTCLVAGGSSTAVGVSASNWGVRGMQASTTANGATCFEAFANGGSNIHHIIFAGNIASGCFSGGFSLPPNGAAGSDYVVAVGNIAYNAAQASSSCFSGFDFWEPVPFDSLAGTHIYLANNFAWHNINPNPCAGTAPTDGEGLLFDTWDAKSYNQQGVMENNISFLNGNSGMRIDLSTQAHMYIQNNSVAANEQQSATTGSEFAEIYLQEDNNATVQRNLVQATVNTVGGFGIYTYGLSFYSQSTGQGTNTVDNNQGYSSFGHNTICSGTCTGFSFGGGNTTTNPAFASVPGSDPGAPSCSSFSTVTACMATIIADFVPSSPSNSGWGYQPVGAGVSDSLFPLWLCSGNALKYSQMSGLVTPGCGVAGAVSSGMHCQSGSPSGGLPGPGGTAPTQGLPCG